MIGNATINKASPFWERKAAIDKAVNDIFDELISEVFAKAKLHPSEQFNRISRRRHDQKNAELYDFINPYHAFCRLCGQHFYTQSFPGDINSFFQKHINTSYHRQLRTIGSHPEDVPILAWEEPLHTARCNVCDLSGLDSFVIQTKFCIKTLMHQHLCVWSWDERETNDKFVKKLSLLKKYCGLKVFQGKFLKTIGGKMVCLLCGVSMSWSEDKAPCHLKSDLHYQKFCMFIWMNFGFAPKDILNGYNLEIVTRWLLLYEPPLWNKLVDLSELSACIYESNNLQNFYPDGRQMLSYSPAYVGMLLRDEDADFVFRDKCLLCGVEVTPGHFSTSTHRAKALDPSNEALTPESCMIYLENRERRLVPHMKIVDRYERLRRSQKGNPVFLPVLSHYIKWMLSKKLPLVDKSIFAVDDREIFCHVCDQYLDRSSREAHLDSFEHNNHLEKWDRLRKDSAKEEFLECFKIVRSVVVCLLCGVMIHTNSFFAHLKSATHTLRLGLYLSLNLDIPVSSSLEFQEDFTCCCTICNSLLGTRNSFVSTLSGIKAHWPCPKFEEVQRIDAVVGDDDGDEPEMQESRVTEQSKGSPPQRRKGRPDRKLKKVVGVVENSANATGDEVANVLENSQYLRDRLTDKRVGCRGNRREFAAKRRGRGGTRGAAPSPSGNAKPSAFASTTVNKGGEASGGEEGKTTTNELRNNSTEDDNTSDQEADEDEDEDEEVLLIKYLPKKKRKCRVLYSKFQSFGKIRYVLFYKEAALVSFVERGVADVAAAEANKVLQEPKVKVEVTERNLIKKKEGTEAEKMEEMVMPKDLMELLEDPQKLVKFMKNLKLLASEGATKEEEAVCNMVIRAVLDWYPRARCYPFGSRLTGMSMISSDLDVFVDCGGMYDGSKNTTPSAEKKFVRAMADALRRTKEARDIIVIERARVPIVSFYHQPTEIHCDLSFKNGLGVQNSLLIKFLTTLDWRVRPIILFMKHWAKEVRLHGPPHFSSYALSMLVINYLEQVDPPVLPTIESLQDSYVGRRLTIGGWDCSINTNKATCRKLTNKDTLEALLLGLFKYYENFDFSQNVVFPLTGQALPREAFSESGRDKLPLCFKRSILNHSLPLENLVSTRFPICIVDPFDLSHVLTKSFSLEGLLQFVYFCQMSRQCLKKGMTDCLPHL